MAMKLLFFVPAAFALAACGDGITVPRHVNCDAFLLQYGAAPSDTINSTQGLRYIDIATGTGTQAAIGMTVDVNYSGYLLNGTRFDTSCPSAQTVLRIGLGRMEVIRGFEFGILGMKPGGVRRLIIPPVLGYGSAAFGPIPANSTLVFDLQFVGYAD